MKHPQHLAEICRRLVSEINYEAEIIKQYKEEAQQETRKTVLEEFINSIGQYVERTEDPSLSGFLETTALMDREDEADRDQKQDKDAVRLMTLHSAKGLEFPRVYLVGMEEGFLPHKRSIDADSEKDIAEERRLAYVGVTRAMDHLTLTRAKSRMKWGKRRETVASRFLFEMQLEPGEALPEEHISREDDGLGTPIQPVGEQSPFVPRPALRPIQQTARRRTKRIRSPAVLSVGLIPVILLYVVWPVARTLWRHYQVDARATRNDESVG